VDEHFRLDLDIGPVQSAIEQLEFVQLKGKFGMGKWKILKMKIKIRKRTK
jgi:hypothetical protein